MLDHALAYADGCRGGVLASSTHPAAMRSYALAGFRLLPTLKATGTVRREALPSELPVRDGSENDLKLAAEVDRRLRGAAHGPDLECMLRTGAHFLVYEGAWGRGYALAAEGSPLVVAATHPGGAADLLRACLTAAGPETAVEVQWMTGDGGWAVRVALACGLKLQPAGPLCVRATSGPSPPTRPAVRFSESVKTG